jgi:hypothetical protein
MSSHDNASSVRSGGSLPPHPRTDGFPAACLVRSRRFILRDGQWMDEAIQAMPQARHIRVRFDSPEFFQLLVKRPELLPNIGSARNVQVALGDTIYEIYD